MCLLSQQCAAVLIVHQATLYNFSMANQVVLPLGVCKLAAAKHTGLVVDASHPEVDGGLSCRR